MTIKRAFLVAGIVAMSMQQALAADSRFIDNMPQLTKDSERAGAMVWTKPGVNRATYTRIMIEPITTYISSNSEYQDLDVNELKALADGFN